MFDGKKIKLLVSDTAPLYPPLWGGPIRIWNLYNNLSKEKFSLDYVGIDFALKERYKVNKIASNFREFLVSLPPHYYLWYPFHKAFFKDLSFDLFFYFMMPTVKEFVRIFENLKADILISSHPWAAPCIKKNKNQLFIYDAHNCEYLLMRAVTKNKLLGGIVSLWTRKIENDACRKSEAILVCSEEEKDDFIRLYGINEKKIYVIPNGTVIKSLPNVKEKKEAKEKLGLIGKKIIIFIGAYYRPNIEAVEFIMDNLALELNEYTFFITGSVKDAFKDRKLPENVKFSGRVSEEELDVILRACDIAVNPMFNGSGINIKMLDYFGYGLPVVTTSCGARGIKGTNGENLIICTPEEFPKYIREIFENSGLYNRLKDNGKKLAEEFYDWKIISQRLEEVIEDLFNNLKN